jgi:hypothetical protein
MLKAQSYECRHETPANEQERFRMKANAWKGDKCLVLTKEQQALLAKDDFETVCRVANNLYGKGVK